MASVSSLNSLDLMQQLQALKGNGSAQSANPATDPFSALLAQMVAGQSQAQTAGQSSTAIQAAGSSGQTSVSTDLNALGQALSSSNLAAAQQAFESLQTDLQSAQKAHHHHHHPQSGYSQSPATQGADATQAVAGTVTGGQAAATAGA